jgi:hypothetical protein
MFYRVLAYDIELISTMTLGFFNLPKQNPLKIKMCDMIDPLNIFNVNFIFS